MKMTPEQQVKALELPTDAYIMLRNVEINRDMSSNVEQYTALGRRMRAFVRQVRDNMIVFNESSFQSVSEKLFFNSTFATANELLEHMKSVARSQLSGHGPGFTRECGFVVTAYRLESNEEQFGAFASIDATIQR